VPLKNFSDRAFVDEHLRSCAACDEAAVAFEQQRRGFAAAGGAAPCASAAARLR